jgi:hypothetical protein
MTAENLYHREHRDTGVHRGELVCALHAHQQNAQVFLSAQDGIGFLEVSCFAIEQ